MENGLKWMRRKATGIVLSGTATIQVLQILVLPTWLDWVTNAVILGGIALVAKMHSDN